MTFTDFSVGQVRGVVWLKLLRNFGKAAETARYALFLIAGGLVLVMLCVTSFDVAGRYFNHPLPGALEICQVTLLSMIALSWAHTQAERGHISIDLVISRMSPHAQAIVDVFNSLLGLVITGFIGVIAISFALGIWRIGATTDCLDIPLHPFWFLMALGMLAFSCQFAAELQHSCRKLWRHAFGDRT